MGVDVTMASIFYSFRRCPYAMRARLALAASGFAVEHREILLKDKPAHMIEASPKATVPVMVLPDGVVIDESLDVMLHVLGDNDPNHLLALGTNYEAAMAEIALCDRPFKQALDHTKYAVRHLDLDAEAERQKAHKHLARWNGLLADNGFLFPNSKRAGTPTLADFAILPFVRQFMGTDKTRFYDEAWPALHAWLNGFLESGIFKTIMTKYEPWKPEDAPLYLNSRAIDAYFPFVNHKA